MTTISEKAVTLLGELAEEVMLTEPDDIQGLTHIHGQFQKLSEIFPSDAPMNAKALVDACSAKLGKAIQGGEQSDDMLDSVGKALAALQPVLRDGALLQIPEDISAEFGVSGGTVCQLPCNVDANIFEEFLAGQPANLDDFEQHLLNLERAEDSETVAALRRLIHTLKGETALLGLNDIERLCHIMEDHLQDGYPKELSDGFFAALDWLRSTFNAIGRNAPFTSPDAIINRFANPSAAPIAAPAAKPAAQEAPAPAAEPEPVIPVVQPAPEPAPAPVSAAPSPDVAVEEVIADPGALGGGSTGPEIIMEPLLPDNPAPSTVMTAAEVLAAPPEPPKPATPKPEVVPPAPAENAEEPQAFKPIINPAGTDRDLLGEFTEEAKEHCETADTQLLALESNHDDMSAVDMLFRVVHTMKGVAGFLGLEEISKLSSVTEDLLDRVRKKTLNLNPNSMDVCFRCVDALKSMIAGLRQFIADGNPPEPYPGLVALIADVRDVLDGKAPAAPASVVKEKAAPAPQPAAAPAAVAETPAPSPEPIAEKVAAVPAPAPAVEIKAEPPAAAPVEKPAPAPEPEPQAVVQPEPAAPAPAPEPVAPVKNEPAAPQPAPAPVAKPEPVAAPAPAPVVEEPQPQHENPGRPAGTLERAPSLGGVKETVRVDADRLDRMIDTIGELVIAESMVDQLIHNPDRNQLALSRLTSQLGKITRELQEIGMSLRMMPVRATFQKMARLVRDVAHKSGKEVELITSGEDTELDKSLVDRIGDPLVHMVRNAVDHGIEPNAAAREAAGKPRVGQVHLSAYHKGGSICIEIGDDGRGLNKDAIYKKAVERGLLPSGVALTDNEIFRTIFEPGFSTAEKITDISGRGVGMDVVKRNVESMRGRIDIESTPGQGTTFVIRLPLTLAIIDGMVIRVGNERYIIPTLSILRSIQPTQKDITTVVGKGEMLRDEGRELPMFRLHTLLNTQNAVTNVEKGIALIVESDGRRIAIFADEILEQQQIVIKSLGDSMMVTGIAGGAIMPDGRVGLILDIGGLMEMMKNNGAAGF